MDYWYIWIILGIIFLIMEIFTVGFVLASFGIGAFIAGIIAWIHLQFEWQIFGFILGTVLVFLGIRPVFIRWLAHYDDPKKTGTAALINQHGLVTEAINNTHNNGRIKLGGEYWKARSEYGEVIPEGTEVVIRRIEGVTVYVNPHIKE